MRRPPTGVGDGPDFVVKVGQLLASSGHGPRYIRGRSAAPQADIDADLPLVREVDSSNVERPILPASTRSKIDQFVEEHERVGFLMEAGLIPSRTLLLTGPPGVGKSMTAAFVASRLGRSLTQMDLAGVISSYLGQTGQNLRRVLDYAREADTVLLLDEFDAIAKRRDDQTDVGELKRIVNVLLVELETWPPGHILIAATNHPELLDRAVRRRFDALVDIPMPGPPERQELLRRATTGRLRERLLRAFALATEGTSPSDLIRMGEAAVREALLRDEDLAKVLARRLIAEGTAPTSRDALVAFAGVAVVSAGVSRREIARLTGKSHPTISRLVDEWRAGE
jgi:SpoVK/Ycf46/Vps4 family AAA+-type ATPase